MEWKKGNPAWVVNLYHGRIYERKNIIREVLIEKVGRKYVTITNQERYRLDVVNTYTEFGIPEEFSLSKYLCPSKEMAERIVEKHELEIHISRTFRTGFNSYTLEQLRAINRIIGGEK